MLAPRIDRAGAVACLLLACLLLAVLPARAERHALLVGVSAYPGLGANLQLTGPAHDVRGLRQVLLQRGFDASRVQVLADGVEGAQGLPTREAILAALDALARRAKPGDTVVVLLSGHGSQEPAGKGEGRTEADGWRETFLPRDVGRWDGTRGAVERSLSDRVLRAAFDRIADQGAFVWGIFDACHSGTLVRGREGAAGGARQVAPGDLGVPGVPPLPMAGGLRAQAAGAGPAGPAAPAAAARPAPAAGDPAPGRAAYFYAAQSGQSVQSVPLPAGVPGAPQRGLLSWSVATGLATGLPMTYGQLAQYVLAQYSRHESAATPLFTGDGLEVPVLDQRAPSWRQWPLDVAAAGATPSTAAGTATAAAPGTVPGNAPGTVATPATAAPAAPGLSLAAGTLDGIAVGALFTVLPGPLATAPPPMRDGTAGVLRVVRVHAARAELEPVPAGGRPATPVTALAPGNWVRLVGSPPSFAMRVAVDRSACPPACAAGAGLDELVRNGVPGVDVRWLQGAQPADVVVQATAEGVRYGLGGPPPAPARAGAPRLAATANSSSSSSSPAPTTPTVLGLALPAGTPPALAAARIAADLHAVARARNLLELAGQIALRTDTPRLETRLELRTRERRLNGGGIEPHQVPTVHDGDGLVLRIRNPGVVPVDMTVLLIDGDHGVSVRYPLDRGESNRLEPGATLEIADMTVNTTTVGTERLVVVWNEMDKHRGRRDFSFLQQPPLGRVRGAGDAAADPALQALLDACFAEQLTRGEAPAIPAVSLGMRVYTLQVTP